MTHEIGDKNKVSDKGRDEGQEKLSSVSRTVMSRRELEQIAREQADRKLREAEAKRKKEIILASVLGTIAIMVVTVVVLALTGVISPRSGNRPGTKGTDTDALINIHGSESSSVSGTTAKTDSAADNAGVGSTGPTAADHSTGAAGKNTNTGNGSTSGGPADGPADGSGTDGTEGTLGHRTVLLSSGQYALNCDLSKGGYDEEDYGFFYDSDIILTLSGAVAGDRIFFTFDGTPAGAGATAATAGTSSENTGATATAGSTAGITTAGISSENTAATATAGSTAADTMTSTSAASGSAIGITAGRIPERYEYSGPIVLEASQDAGHPYVYAVRAQIVHADGTMGEEWIHTFFVAAGIDERYSTTVVSIIGDPAELTDEPDGVMFGDNAKDGGRDSEVKVHLEMMEADGTAILSQNCGFRVYGGDSRMWAVKSMKLFARKEYSAGKGTFETDLFGTKRVDKPEKTVRKYDKLVIRNGGDDFQRSFLRDELSMTLAQKAGFTDYEAVVPVTVYLNGEYYSQEWLHEAYCDEYFQRRYGQTEGTYIDIEGTETYKSVSGSPEDEAAAAREFNSMYSKTAYSDLTVEENYRAVRTFIDVENYLRYIAFQMFIGNNDWPDNNYRCYRYYAAEGEEYEPGTVRDGRWRFLLHDTDVGFGTYYSTGYRFNILADLLNRDGDKYAAMFTHLMERDDCREYFVNYVKYLYGEVLTYDSVAAEADRLDALRAQELPYYMERFAELKAEGVPEIFASLQNSVSHMDIIRNYSKERGEYVRTQVTELLGWPEDQEEQPVEQTEGQPVEQPVEQTEGQPVEQPKEQSEEQPETSL